MVKLSREFKTRVIRQEVRTYEKGNKAIGSEDANNLVNALQADATISQRELNDLKRMLAILPEDAFQKDAKTILEDFLRENWFSEPTISSAADVDDLDDVDINLRLDLEKLKSEMESTPEIGLQVVYEYGKRARELSARLPPKDAEMIFRSLERSAMATTLIRYANFDRDYDTHNDLAEAARGKEYFITDKREVRGGDVWKTTYWPMAGDGIDDEGDPRSHLWAKEGVLAKFDRLLEKLGHESGALDYEKTPALKSRLSGGNQSGYFIPNDQLNERDAERSTGVDLDGDGTIRADVNINFIEADGGLRSVEPYLLESFIYVLDEETLVKPSEFDSDTWIDVESNQALHINDASRISTIDVERQSEWDGQKWVQSESYSFSEGSGALLVFHNLLDSKGHLKEDYLHLVFSSTPRVGDGGERLHPTELSFNNTSDVSWWGSCDKVALAGMLFSEPKKEFVEYMGETFTKQDMMGLLTLISQSQSQGTDFFGDRYNNQPQTLALKDGTRLDGYLTTQEGEPIVDSIEAQGAGARDGDILTITDPKKKFFGKTLNFKNAATGEERKIQTKDIAYISAETPRDMDPREVVDNVYRWLSEGRAMARDEEPTEEVWNAPMGRFAIFDQERLSRREIRGLGTGVAGKISPKNNVIRYRTEIGTMWLEFDKNNEAINAGWWGSNGQTDDFFWRAGDFNNFTGFNDRNPFVKPEVVEELYKLFMEED